jgi:hypothetical protein
MRGFLLSLVLVVGCAESGFPDLDASTAIDAHVSMDMDAGVTSDAASVQDGSTPFVAPPGFVSGEVLGADGENVVVASATHTAVFRVESEPGEHIGFFLTFADTFADVTLSIDRYDGQAAHELWYTDGGRGIRTIAIFDEHGPRTHWVRIDTTETAFAGTLEIVRTPFGDGATCVSDCARLLQLPVPIDEGVEGYRLTPGTILRYQFGRRDLLMFVRHAAQTLAAAGYAPFLPADFSQWDGLTPGTDTGSSRHASHQRGKDVDLSLYGTDGLAPFRSYCTTVHNSDGRACLDGTVMGFDGYANARFYAAILASGRVTMSFLDGELIPFVRAGATAGIADGVIPASLAPLYTDGVRLQHWPNHDNHIHVRVSETAYPAPGGRTRIFVEPFEAP